MPPEKLLRALLLQTFYGVRSERQLMEHVGYNMLLRWVHVPTRGVAACVAEQGWLLGQAARDGRLTVRSLSGAMVSRVM
jgi:hypothetical protein